MANVIVGFSILFLINVANGQHGHESMPHHEMPGHVANVKQLPPLHCPVINDADVKSFDLVINKTSPYEICQHFDIPNDQSYLMVAVINFCFSNKCPIFLTFSSTNFWKGPTFLFITLCSTVVPTKNNTSWQRNDFPNPTIVPTLPIVSPTTPQIKNLSQLLPFSLSWPSFYRLPSRNPWHLFRKRRRHAIWERLFLFIGHGCSWRKFRTKQW